MGDRTATVIIEPRSLVREALVSLMENHSYNVVCSVASAAEIDHRPAVIEAPQLVIFGGLSGDCATAMTPCIRGLWSKAKIVVLFERDSSADIQKIMTSDIDGCIPMFVSPRTLMGTLQLIIAKDLRILVLGDANLPRTPIANQSREQNTIDAATIQSVDMPVERMASWSEPADSGVRYNVSVPHFQNLSGREEQILKALIEGHSNKVIARMCTVTEATVKVHMKSILRKIRVANRTQAAIWALGHGYVAGTPNGAPLATEVSKGNGHGI
jgi:two-component system, NarL family, nitrate/nitrite response regulator NarL